MLEPTTKFVFLFIDISFFYIPLVFYVSYRLKNHSVQLTQKKKLITQYY